MSSPTVIPLLSTRNKKSMTKNAQPVFDGTIAAAFRAGVSPERFIEMTRLASASEPRVALFLNEWDALGTPEREETGVADAICERVGLAPIELLRIVAEVTCRVAIYIAQIITATAHPDVVRKNVERALDDNCANAVKYTEMLHKATGFLPTPRGSQTAITIMQNAQANPTASSQPVAPPRPEDTIRQLADCFNAARGLPPTPRIAWPKGDTAPAALDGTEDGVLRRPRWAGGTSLSASFLLRSRCSRHLSGQRARSSRYLSSVGPPFCHQSLCCHAECSSSERA